MTVLPELTIVSSSAGDAVTVVVRGEVDLATAPQLRDELLDHILGGSSLLRLDLQGVSFMDSSGLHVLIASQRRAALMGGGLVLARTSKPVDRRLEVTGAARLFAPGRAPGMLTAR